MSLRNFPKNYGTAALTALVLNACACGVAFAGTMDLDPRLVPPVQNYAEQAVPVAAPAPQQYYDSPLAAGTLTLQDVLEAHKPNPETATLPAIGATPSSTATAPMLTPSQTSSTSLMMSQGMRSVLQKVGDTAVSVPTVRPPTLNGQPPIAAQRAAEAQAVPASLLPDGATTPIPASVPGIKYEPGQEPKNLDGSAITSTPLAPVAGNTTSATGTPTSETAAAPVESAPAPIPAASSASPIQSCDKDVQKWQKSCGDAGYPADYVGKIIGETHTGCADGQMHDIWVSNSCAPPDAATSQTPSTNAVCGAASNNMFDEAPTTNLCAQGIASPVSGSGPWTWACSGVNGGQAAACTARTRVSTVNGACGTANGVAVYSSPISGLCDAGDATAVKGSGPWTWSCRGLGSGSTQTCIAPVASVATTAPVAAADKEVSSQTEPAAAPVAAVTHAAAMPAEKSELCGSAAETLAYEAPSKDLCRAGSASVVNGDGPWSWACTDNEGRSSTCRTLSLNADTAAPAAAPAVAESATAESAETPALQTSPRIKTAATAAATDNLACGVAATEATAHAPTDDLCVNGKASKVRGSGPWQWSCNKGKHKVSCETPTNIDGVCGAANGAALKSAPFAGLCAAGAPTGIEGNGPWNWTCNGSGGGVNVSCAASLQTPRGKVEGVCGPSADTTVPTAPDSGLCSSGSPSAVSGSGPWTWSCSGSNGGGVSSCQADKLSPTQAPGPMVNGQCGPANGMTSAAQPSDGLCAAGSMTGIVGNGPWNWSCLGENGGMTVSCTAPLEPPEPINGACGQANGVSTLVKPQSGLCSAGITGTVSGRGPWTWSCSGANGGSPASCVAPVAGKTGAMPSITTVGTDNGAIAAPAAAQPDSLTTPRLPSSTNSALPPLDSKTIPSLTSSGLKTPHLAGSNVPPATTVTGDEAPYAVPSLQDGSPVPPPAISGSITSAPSLQESAEERAAHIPGNHLTLDPTISTILFTRGSGNIDEAVLTTLDKLSAVLQSNPDVRITLTAYADNEGSTPRDARRLSLTRALAVRDYLGSKGISDSRVDVRAEGANTTSGYIDRVDVKVNE